MFKTLIFSFCFSNIESITEASSVSQENRRHTEPQQLGYSEFLKSSQVKKKNDRLHPQNSLRCGGPERREQWGSFSSYTNSCRISVLLPLLSSRWETLSWNHGSKFIAVRAQAGLYHIAQVTHLATNFHDELPYKYGLNIDLNPFDDCD